MLITKEEGKSKVLSRGFCLFDSETERRALQFLHIYCSDVRSHSSAPGSNKQNQLSSSFPYLSQPVAWPRSGMGGNCPSPLFSKDGPRDSFKIEEKMAGYRFGKNLSQEWPADIT